MTPIQKLLINILASLFLGAAVVLMVSNMDLTTDVNFWGEVYTQVPLGALLGGVAVLVGASLAMKLWEMMLLVRKSTRKVERQLERAEVTAEVSGDKVKAMEAKIATLETALSKALDQLSKSSGSKS